MAHPLPRAIWRPGQVEERPLHTLLPAATNARTHSPAQLRKLARSIAAFGFTSPVLVDAAGRIVAGHGRVAAARDLGMATVPTVRLDHLTAAQCRALALADNRIAELAGWDRELLSIELDGLLQLDDGFDLSLTGFDGAEIGLVLHDPAAGRAAPAPRPAAAQAVSRPGDLWILGRHTLLCADAATPPAWGMPPGGEPAAMLFAAPPEVDPPHTGPPHTAPPGIAPGLRGTLAAAVAASRPAALHYLCVGWRGLGGLAAAADGLYAGQADLCVWDHGGSAERAPPQSPYRPQHALVAVYRTPGAAPAPGGLPGAHSGRRAGRRRQRTNLWRHPAEAAHPAEVHAAGVHAAGVHASRAATPPQLIADAILDATRPGETVLDPWGGCGGTLLAAERTDRRARLAEADPRRADHAVRRWQAETGGTAALAGPGGDPGDDFETIARHRNREITDAA